MKFFNRALTLFSCFLILIYSIFPFVPVIYAQEVDSASLLQATESAELNLTIKEGTSPEPIPISTPSLLWTEQNGAYVTETLQLGVTYRFPPNEKVSLIFSKLPENSGTVTVKEHEVPGTVKNAGSKDYEITSSMPNGSFEFDLTLPTNNPGKKVLTSNDGQNYDVAPNETVVSSDVVTIKGVTHLTHFIIGDATDTFNHVVINEFLPGGSSEWVEMYNPTSQEQNITGWSIEDNDPLTGNPFIFPDGSTVPAKGFLVADVNNGFAVLLNDTGDTVNFINGMAETVDSHTYSSDPGANSIGRTIDGGPNFQEFTTPTQGLSNGTTLNTLYVNPSWDSQSNDGGHSWGFDAFATIADAINFAPEGSTINVEPGTYYESLNINKPLTLSGSGTSLVTIAGCDSTLNIAANSVSISGFFVTNECGYDATIFVSSNLQNVTISGNIIRDGYYGIYTNSPVTIQGNEIMTNIYGIYLTNSIGGSQITGNNIHDNGEGISARGVTFNTLSISNNQILNSNDGYGIYFNGFSNATLTISGNTITGGSYTGIYLSGFGAQISNSTVTVSGNTISSNGGDGIYADVIINSTFDVLNNVEINGNSGNGIYICADGYCSEGSSITISGNTINSNSSRGIYLYDVRDTSTVSITNNVIGSNGEAGIYLDSSVTNTTITENTIENNGFSSLSTGVVVNNVLGNEAHENTISGNGDIEIQNSDPINAFNATLNWWGTAVASEISAKLSGLVNFSPWYTDAERTTQASLRTGKAITLFDFSLPSVDGVVDETDHTVALYVPNGTDVTNLVPNITVSDGATIYPESGATSDFTNTVTYTVTAEDGLAQEYIVTVNVVAEDQIVPDSDGNVTVTDTDPKAVITSPTQAVNLTISSGTTNPTIDYSSLIVGGTGTIPQTTIDSEKADIAIPASTTVTSADPTWNGVIAAPTVTTVTLPETLGETKTLSTAVEVGFTGAKLSFNKAVRLLLTGQAGKKAGYVRTGIAFTEITSTCSADNQATGDALAADGDCKIDVGLDLVIWTKHFTTFASYTQTTNSSSSSSSGSGLSAASAPSCGDQKPGSAPTLILAVTGNNFVTLTWNKAAGPVSYYLVNYSRVAGKFEYGNPNVGGAGVTSYTVGGLSGGTTYYFKVRAGNGCAAGDYSNEVSATPGGGFVQGPATGFIAGVLGAKTSEVKELSQISAPVPDQPQQEQKSSGNLLGNIINAILGFISKLFRQ